MSNTLITSSTNSLFKVWKSLLTSKGIKENKQFFLMGKKLVDEFLMNPNPDFKIEYVIFETELNLQIKAKITQLSNELFKELDVLGTRSPLLILSFADFIEKDFSKDPKGLELICPLGDPRNLGALARSAKGFGATELILTKESTHPFLPHSVKASAGSVLNLRFRKSKMGVNEIPIVGENYALALFGEEIAKLKWPKNLRLWVGEEGPGLQLELTQKRRMKFINIPTQGIESLNAMVSTSIALFDWKSRS